MTQSLQSGPAAELCTGSVPLCPSYHSREPEIGSEKSCMPDILAVRFMYIRVYLVWGSMSANMTIAVNLAMPIPGRFEEQIPRLKEAALSLDSLLIFRLDDRGSLDRPGLEEVEAFAALFVVSTLLCFVQEFETYV
jgi:hypothetical protein